MYSIALLVPVCSRNQNYKTIEDIPFFKYLWPSFLKTYNPKYNYTFYLGIDETDEFYMENYKKITSNYKNIGICSIILKDCEHKPAWAWNKLFKTSCQFHNYFYQIGDDIFGGSGWGGSNTNVTVVGGAGGAGGGGGGGGGSGGGSGGGGGGGGGSGGGGGGGGGSGSSSSSSSSSSSGSGSGSGPVVTGPITIPPIGPFTLMYN